MESTSGSKLFLALCCRQYTHSNLLGVYSNANVLSTPRINREHLIATGTQSHEYNRCSQTLSRIQTHFLCVNNMQEVFWLLETDASFLVAVTGAMATAMVTGAIIIPGGGIITITDITTDASWAMKEIWTDIPKRIGSLIRASPFVMNVRYFNVSCTHRTRQSVQMSGSAIELRVCNCWIEWCIWQRCRYLTANVLFPCCVCCHWRRICSKLHTYLVIQTDFCCTHVACAGCLTRTLSFLVTACSPSVCAAVGVGEGCAELWVVICCSTVWVFGAASALRRCRITHEIKISSIRMLLIVLKYGSEIRQIPAFPPESFINDWVYIGSLRYWPAFLNIRDWLIFCRNMLYKLPCHADDNLDFSQMGYALVP